MKITFDLDFDEAAQLRGRLLLNMADPVGWALAQDLIEALDNAIQDEDERRSERQQERAMESGIPDDSKYHQDMKDAGRGHLLR